MRQSLLIWIILATLLPVLAQAKRVPPPKLEPVLHQGVRYTSHDGTDTPRRQCVQALDIKTGKVLWDATVFRTFMFPFVEECLQVAFIKRMFVDEGRLIVVAENGRAYRLDLST